MAALVGGIYAAVVCAAMLLSLWPGARDAGELMAVLLSLPWGLGAYLALDTINRDMVAAIGAPLVAIFGLLNAFLLFNALRGRRSRMH